MRFQQKEHLLDPFSEYRGWFCFQSESPWNLPVLWAGAPGECAHQCQACGDLEEFRGVLFRVFPEDLSTALVKCFEKLLPCQVITTWFKVLVPLAIRQEKETQKGLGQEVPPGGVARVYTLAKYKYKNHLQLFQWGSTVLPCKCSHGVLQQS